MPTIEAVSYGANAGEAPASVHETPNEPVVVKPKPVVEVLVSSIYNKVCEGVYLETEESIDQFVEALKVKLLSIVRNKKRIRIR